jgi:hypothetical protein
MCNPTFKKINFKSLGNEEIYIKTICGITYCIQNQTKLTILIRTDPDKMFVSLGKSYTINMYFTCLISAYELAQTTSFVNITVFFIQFLKF